MNDAVEIVQYVNLGLYTVVAAAAVWLWWRHRERAGLWAALAFVALASIVDIGRLLPEDPTSDREKLALKVLIAGLVLFPYLLYRFATSFRPPSRSLSLLIGGITVIVLAWTFVLTDIPGEGEAWPTSFAVYVAAFTIHWTLLTVVVTYRLWTAGRGEASVPRKRMRLLAVAAATITLALLISVSGTSDGSAASLVATLLSSLSALLFLIGLAPPAILRTAWRRPETTRLQGAIAELMGATDAKRGRRATSCRRWRRSSALRPSSCGTSRASCSVPTGTPPTTRTRIVAVDSPAGEVKLWTSTYTPFFGAEELALVRTLAALTALALDRARLFSHEREMREALERADEIKTNFVSLAAHELRTPVATIHGLVETIYARRDELEPDQLDELETVLRGQTTRMKALVEQLLDLSRLEADAVDIRPRRSRSGRASRRSSSRRSARTRASSRSTSTRDSSPRSTRTHSTASSPTCSSTRAATARLPFGSRAEKNDRHFRVTVEDQGEGVPPEFVPDLFERFTRSTSARVAGRDSASRSPARTRRRTAAT